MTASYHTPGLEEMLERMEHPRGEVFRQMFSGWRSDVAKICGGIQRVETALEVCEAALKDADWDDTRPVIEIEWVLLKEKAPYWTAKQIGRVLKRSPECIYRMAQKIHIRIPKRKQVE